MPGAGKAMIFTTTRDSEFASRYDRAEVADMASLAHYTDRGAKGARAGTADKQR